MTKPTVTLPFLPLRPAVKHLPLLDITTLPRTTFWTVLGQALVLRRDDGSITEAAFVAWLLNRLPVSMVDTAGNVYVDLRTKPDHRTMFTSHTDTVHSCGGVNNVRVDGKMWRADDGAALGADDGAGIALMCHMIEAGVPGLYVFFRGEERGGIGSSWASSKMSEAFEHIDRAIAFDRADYYDIITHQSGGRCCSDEFAQALANELSTETHWFLPSSHGVYTDTAEFTRLIPECTNLSVGYKHQHGDCEEQDIEFLWQLAQTLVLVKWDQLPTLRNPKIIESQYSGPDDWVEEYHKQCNEDPYKDEDFLYAAIDDAYQNRPAALIKLISESVALTDFYPSLNANRITDEILDIAMHMLDEGWEPDNVLEELFNELYVY